MTVSRERRYVRHKKTGMLLRWNEVLAKAADWETVDPPSPPPVDPAPVRRRRPRKQPELTPDVEVQRHTDAGEISSSGQPDPVSAL